MSRRLTPDEAAAQVALFSEAEMYAFLDQLIGRPAVNAAGFSIRENTEEKKKTRNDEIRSRRAAGATLGQLARDFRLSRAYLPHHPSGRKVLAPCRAATRALR